MTDALKVIAENTAIPAAIYTDEEAGKVMTHRWAEKDIPEKKETRTGKEVIADIKKKLEVVE